MIDEMNISTSLDVWGIFHAGFYCFFIISDKVLQVKDYLNDILCEGSIVGNYSDSLKGRTQVFANPSSSLNKGWQIYATALVAHTRTSVDKLIEAKGLGLLFSSLSHTSLSLV